MVVCPHQNWSLSSRGSISTFSASRNTSTKHATWFQVSSRRNMTPKRQLDLRHEKRELFCLRHERRELFCPPKAGRERMLCCIGGPRQYKQSGFGGHSVEVLTKYPWPDESWVTQYPTSPCPRSDVGDRPGYPSAPVPTSQLIYQPQVFQVKSPATNGPTSVQVWLL